MNKKDSRGNKRGKCSACRGYGFLLIYNTGKRCIEIERCDDCGEHLLSDEDATLAVFELAKLALDTADMLADIFDRDDPRSDYAKLFKTAKRWAEGKKITRTT